MQQRTTTTWGRPPVQGSPRLRVLIESHDAALAISDFHQFDEQGFDVALCSGPANGPGECPLVRGDGCPLAAGADVVLFNLAARGSAVLEASARQYAGTPIVIQLPAGSETGLPEGCEPLRPFTSVQGQISVLRRAALNGRRRRSAAVT